MAELTPSNNTKRTNENNGEEFFEQIGEMTVTQLRAMVNNAVEDRIGVLESVIENQTFNVNEMENKFSNFMSYMPTGLSRDQDLTFFIREAARQLHS